MAQRSWFGWDGDRLVSTETHTPEGRERVCTVYEPQSFVPLLRFAWVHREEGGASGGATITNGVPNATRDGQAPQAVSSPQLLYFHCNHLGTPQALIDRQGQIVWQAEFDPWGNVRSEFNPQQISQPIRMQGQQLDLETGLFYNRYRYYAPQMGRYVTQDPIGLLGGMNKCCYPGNPNQSIDPTGMYAIPLIYAALEATAAWIASLGATAATATVTLGGAAVVASIPGSSPIQKPRTAAEEAQAQSEYKAYKNRCEQKPDDNLSNCAKALFTKSRHEDCAKMRQDWDDKWMPGRHANDITSALKAAGNAAKDVAKYCKPTT